jgi:acyl-CoA thioester hydrolase
METDGVHMDRQARKSTPFAAAIRNATEKHLEPAMA